MTARYMQGLRSLSPAVLLYFVTIAIIGFSVDGGVYSVLLNLFLLRLGYGPELIGLVNSAGMLTFALACLPAGALGGRWGSRRVMLGGLALMLVGCTLLPLADALEPRWRLPWLLANDVLLYAGLALYFVNTAPFVMGLVSSAQRNQVFSFQTALLSLASFVGSLVGGLLPPAFAAALGMSTQQPAPFRYALMVAGLAMLPAMLAIRTAREGDGPPPEEPAAAEGAPAATSVAPILGLLVLMALVRLFQVSGIAATNTFFNVYLDAQLLVPTAQIGAITAAGRLLGVPAALATAALTSRFGNRNVVIWATVGTALSIMPIALVPHWGAAGLSFIGVVALSWIRYTASLVYFLELVPPAKRATVSGVMETAGGLCFTAVTFGGGYLIAFSGYRTLFLLGAALTLVSALLFWLGFRNRSAQPPS